MRSDPLFGLPVIVHSQAPSGLAVLVPHRPPEQDFAEWYRSIVTMRLPEQPVATVRIESVD